MKSLRGGNHDQNEAPPSRHLWVGNVAQEVTEGQLVDKFSKFGPIENVTVYSQRNYAFVNFRNLDNARDSKSALQGIVLGGLAMRIEFAKGAKPSRHLWVGGICHSVSREEIEAEFKQFGIMNDFKFLRDRNCAFVDYERIEDAIAAVETLNLKRLGDEELRVDFGRSQPPKREASFRSGSTRSYVELEGPMNIKDVLEHPYHITCPGEVRQNKASPEEFTTFERGFSNEDLLGVVDELQGGSGARTITSTPLKTRGGKEEPSDVLWVGFPFLSKVDGEGLRRAFVPYGEVQRVRTFPGRTYAFVQFKNSQEAFRAKDALDGKLFNDPRIHIRFSSSDVGSVDNQMIDGNCLSQSCEDTSETANKVVGKISTSCGRFGAIISPLRATGLRPEYYPGGLGRGGGLSRAVGTGVVSFFRGAEKTTGRVGSLGSILFDSRNQQSASQHGRGSLGLKNFESHTYGEQWDLRDGEMILPELKRQKTSSGGGLDFNPNVEEETRQLSGLQSVGLGPGSVKEGYPLPLSKVSDKCRAHLGSIQVGRTRLPDKTYLKTGILNGSLPSGSFSSARMRDGFCQGGVSTSINEGWTWQGTIAKGGTPVCRARCLPVGKGIDVAV